ncbi:ABC transporter ATP-binding protein [Bacillus sp. 03113]|uniref:ABC transporter ATP-binding protein n=1 Tax=Bacillus sp. 03113 TaxID=2578211 RepID=UPI001142AD8D|nr:ABC transporter ATP-binding protein [Bacillus sp. 03113]
MNKIMEVKELTRTYKLKKGTKTALNQVSFDVYEGEVFGLLGPNGAGKTTTIKILTTMLLPTSGTVKILGHDVVNESQKIRDQINFVYGGERGVYGKLTAKEYMYYFCTLYKIPRKKQKELLLRLLSLVGLKEAMDQQIFTFSKGMIQRLHIARSLINDPKLIFLDEPTIGLDPVGAKLLRKIVKELAEKGISILLTTHYMQEADELCDRIAFIKDGQIRLIGKPEQIKKSCNHLNLFEATIQIYDITSLQQDRYFLHMDVEEINSPYYVIKFEISNNISMDQLSSYLNHYGEVLKLKRKEISLEDAYLFHMKDVG